MAIRFILARSGAGKTRACVDGIIAALLDGGDGPLVLLTPEQATYQAERAVLSDARIGGYSRLHVLSFSRLAFLLQGRQTALPELSGLGRELLVHRILQRLREQLTVYHRSAERLGLAREISGVLGEFQHFEKTPGDLADFCAYLEKEGGHPLTAAKFGDLRLIYTAYLEELQGRFVNPDAQLTAAREAQEQLARHFGGCQLWVDGFAGFTTQETLMLMQLLRVAREARIALCLDHTATGVSGARPDAGALDPLSLFAPTERTYCDLVERIEGARLDLAAPLVLEERHRFAEAAGLRHVEANLFAPDAAVAEATNEIQIVAAGDARSEVTFVAREIRKLLAEKAGWRYRDVAVIVSDLEGYEPLLRTILADYEIPCFIDAKQTVLRHPLFELLAAATRIATEGMSTAAMLNVLKSDLAGLTRDEVDCLENYCIAYGVDHEAWTQEAAWRYAVGGRVAFDEERVDGLRRQAAGPLVELTAALREEPLLTGADFVRMMFAFCEQLGVRETLAEWIAEGGEDRADYHQQCYNKVVDLCDELQAALGDEAMGLEQLGELFQAALAGATLAFIPPRLDQVLVGAIERSRHPDVKATFIVGATQRQFPTRVAAEAILSDADRTAAEAAGFTLNTTLEQDLTDRQYLAYIAFTRPSRRLTITHPLTDEKGGPTVRSAFVTAVEELFAETGGGVFHMDAVDAGAAVSKTELADCLALQLGPDGVDEETRGKRRALLAGLAEEAELAAVAETVQGALGYRNGATLPEGLAAELLGEQIYGSVSRLQTFAACPYQHFARYTLGVEPRARMTMEATDLGILYHEVLDRTARALARDGEDFGTAEAERLEAVVRQEAEAFVKEDAFYRAFAGKSLHNRFVIDAATATLVECVWELAVQCRAGRFRLRASELHFGLGAEDLPAYRCELADGRSVALRGKIDRVDTVTVEGDELAVVFDYKSGVKKVKWTEVYHGLDMQLVSYLLALQGRCLPGETTAVQVVGGFFLPIQAAAEKGSLDVLEEGTEKAGGFLRKGQGMVNGELFDLLDGETGPSKWSKYYNMYKGKEGDAYGNFNKTAALHPEELERLLGLVRERIGELAESIYAGVIDIAPYRLSGKGPCGHCDYRGLCRFDWRVNEVRLLDKMKKEEVLQKQ